MSSKDYAVNNNVPQGPDWQDNEITLVEIANTILRQWRVVVVVPLALAFVVALWTLGKDRTYTASASFIPQVADSRGGAGAGAAALAEQFGVSLGTERPGQSPQFYVDLLRSRAVLREAVESEYQVPTDDGTAHKANLIELFEIEDDGHPLPLWWRAMEELEERISTSVARETGVVQFTVSASHSAVAEQVAERLLEILNTFNTELRQSRAQEEGRFIASRLAEAQSELRAAEDALQEFLHQNREFRNSPELMFEHERLQRQVAMRQELYTSLLRSQERVQIDAVRDTPLFTVIDHPAGMAEPQGRGTVLRTMLAFLLGLMVAVAVVFIREATRRRREADDPQYREFQGLARQAWEDLRHPKRWLRRGQKPVGTDRG